MSNARMTFSKGKVDIDVPYVATFVSEIKDIPSHFRTYDPVKKRWTVFQPHIGTARKIVRRYFPHVIEIGANDYEEAQAREKAEQEAFNARQKENFRQRGEEERARAQREEARRQRHQQEHRENDEYFRRQRSQYSSSSFGGFGGKDDYATLYVTRDAPKEVIKAAYRALSLIHHPDKGGDPERMKTINAAYDRIGPK